MLIERKNNFKISKYGPIWFPLLVIIFYSNTFTRELAFVIIIFYTLLGIKQIIQSFFLIWFLMVLNPEIAQMGNGINIFRYLIFFSGAISCLIHCKFKKIDYFIFSIILFFMLTVLHSIFFSAFPSVSILKIINWALIMSILYLSWSALELKDEEKVQRWLTNFLISIMFLSVFTFFFQKIGFSKNVDYFQGILRHPQTFGITLSVLIIILFGKIFSEVRFNKFLIFYLIVALLLLILTNSRTSILSTFFVCIGYLIFFFISKILKKKTLLKYMYKFSSSFLIILIFFTILYLNRGEFKWEEISIFNILKNFETSRKILYEPMLQNIQNNFFSGIGFGISSDPSFMKISRDPFFGIPFKAPVEKGITFLMILEELGIFGFFLFSIWLIFLFYRTKKNGLLPMLLFFNIILLNFGESLLFSPGGTGLLLLIFLTKGLIKRI